MGYQNICVVGLGYIGLPTSSLLASRGFNVHGVDVRPEVVAMLNRGELHIVEKDLGPLLEAAVQSGRFKAALQPREAEVFIIAVPTPFLADKAPDMSYVETATRNIAPYLRENNLVILESTSPVGTTDNIKKTLSQARPDLKNFYVAHCPERVIPGKVLQELVENDRVVGGVDDESTEKAGVFYRTFVAGQICLTDAKTAEMCKLTENAFRDVNIAFANELSVICEELHIDVWELIRLANRHPRVNILQPGPGVGGHCIAVDPWFIIAAAPESSLLLKAARHVNDAKPERVIDKVKSLAKQFKDPVIACLGVAFKADIDDLRESPSLMIAKRLHESNVGKVIICEPNVRSLAGFNLVELSEALRLADILVVLVDHKQFKSISKQDIADKVVVDTKGIFSI